MFQLFEAALRRHVNTETGYNSSKVVVRDEETVKPSVEGQMNKGLNKVNIRESWTIS